jgi:ABC-type antimicrobial peptide transport system permease subunit
VTQTLAQRLFPAGHAVDHHLIWTDPLIARFLTVYGFRIQSMRIVGVVPDVDNKDLVPKPTMAVYQPFDQQPFLGGGHLLVNAHSDPYALVKPITRILRAQAADQPVEHARTLQDIRAEVLSEDRLNAIVSGIFAGVALLIAVVGVAGVLAFSVSGRTREFGIRLAVGSDPRHLLFRVIAEGAAMAVGGLAVGCACGYWLGQLAASLLGDLKMPGALPIAGSALVLLLAAIIASAIPAARAARIDVMQALRTE